MRFDARNYLPDTRCVIVADCDCERQVIDYSVKNGRFVHTRPSDNKTLIKVSTEFEGELRSYLEAQGIKSVRKRSCVYGYRRRWGILVGLLIFAAMISYFSGILWSVDVSGNTFLTDYEVKDLLRECGVFEGARLKQINNDLVRIKIMAMSQDIAWISVNVKGMKADVVIAEAERPPKKEKEDAYSHIVAKCDGLITAIVIERGQQMVRVGETVKKGDLLVSGIIEERDGDVSLVNASARVYAQTEKNITAEQPYVRESVSFSKGILRTISLKSFGKSIKFSIKYGLSGDSCDIISKSGSVYIFGGFRLPIDYVAEYMIAKRVDAVSLTRDEARSAAENEAYRLLFSNADAELISKRFRYDYGEDVLKVALHAVCEENIAQRIPFTAEP